jgi:hypothetical protein
MGTNGWLVGWAGGRSKAFIKELVSRQCPWATPLRLLHVTVLRLVFGLSPIWGSHYLEYGPANGD